MRIACKKISTTPKAFSIHSQGVCLKGSIVAKDDGLFCMDAILEGELLLICDSSGEEFLQAINERLILYISDGIWDTQSQHIAAFDVIECLHGVIDIEDILHGEIESIKLGYHKKPSIKEQTWQCQKDA